MYSKAIALATIQEWRLFHSALPGVQLQFEGSDYMRMALINERYIPLKLGIPYSEKIFAWCKFSRFSKHAGEHENKYCENFNERTLELEDGPPLLFQDLCGSLPCTSSAARRTFDLPCVSTNSKRDSGGDRLHGFLLRRWRKATKPTGIAGPLFLAKKCLAWGKLATRLIFFINVKTRQRSVTLKSVFNCCVLLMRK